VDSTKWASTDANPGYVTLYFEDATNYTSITLRGGNNSKTSTYSIVQDGQTTITEPACNYALPDGTLTVSVALCNRTITVTVNGAVACTVGDYRMYPIYTGTSYVTSIISVTNMTTSSPEGCVPASASSAPVVSSDYSFPLFSLPIGVNGNMTSIKVGKKSYPIYATIAIGAIVLAAIMSAVTISFGVSVHRWKKTHK